MISLFHGRMERLCALSVIGEISQADSFRLQKHLETCAECRAFNEDLHKIASVDLRPAASRPIACEMTRYQHSIDENRLLANLLERTGHLSGVKGKSPLGSSPATSSGQVKLSLGWLSSTLGWAMAALLLFAWLHAVRKAPAPGVPAQPTVATNRPVVAPGGESWASRIKAIEDENSSLRRDLLGSRTQLASFQDVVQQTSQKNAILAHNLELLESQLEAGNEHVRQLNAALTANEANLEAERHNATNLQEQLAVVNAQLNTQQSEAAHLRDIAATNPVYFSSAAHDIDAADALEIVRARDLHIVDVYDVDHRGNSAKSYGRVYYVNRQLLLFYAFDLASNTHRNHKAVAFQAWGVGAQDSAPPKSLGLFYLDNSKLDRWVLRVSDPEILSRIETLFVTIEPPGGSRVPRGHQLLFASLAGPANHP